jgi:GT2 family glycosyltransferase
MSSVSVAVVVKDRCEPMSRCLDALELQTLKPAQLIVIDNGSTDGTVEMLRARGIDVIVQLGSLGLARQVAVDRCTSELLAWTDSDCRPRPAWLAELVSAASSGAAVVQGRTVAEDAPRPRWSRTLEIDRWTDIYECCNLLYRVDVLREVGGFDTSIGFFGEDTAPGWRIRRVHGQGVFAPDAVVEHAVTYPGLQWHLRRGLRYAVWPRLVREFPEMREVLFHKGVFLNRHRPPVAMAAAGLVAAVAVESPLPLLAALPWLYHRRPSRSGTDGLLDSFAGLAFDAAVSVGLAAGAVKERRVVL